MQPRERRRSPEREAVELAAPGRVGEGTIIAFPDIFSADSLTDAVDSRKERPFMRIDATPPGTDRGGADNAFPYAHKQGFYVGLSSTNQGGACTPVPPTAFSVNTGNVQLDRTSTGYAVPWLVVTIDTLEARPVIGRADSGTVQAAREGVADTLAGRLGPGNFGQR